MRMYLKDLSADRQPVLLLMRVKNGMKEWRLNFNIMEKLPTDSSQEDVQYECDFVPENGGITGNPPAFELFEQYLTERGLTDESIEQIRTEYNGFVDANQTAFLEEIV